MRLLKSFMAVVTVAVLFTGCSSQYSLSYEPSLDLPIRRPVDLSVTVLKPELKEEELKPKEGTIVIGEIGPDHFFEWLSGALKGELERLGYHIKTSGSESQYQIFLGKLDSTDGKISLEVSVKDQDELIFIKRYSSTKPVTFPLYKIFFGLERLVNKLMNSSLQEIYEQFILDLDQVVDEKGHHAVHPSTLYKKISM